MVVFKSFLIPILATLSISFTSSQDSYTCNLYRCSEANLQKDQCIYSHNLGNSTSQHIYDISLQCEKGFFCPANFNDANVTCTSRTPFLLKVDGETCLLNTDCFSNKCNTNKCEGVANMGVCTDHSECTLGHYCKKLTNVSVVSNCVLQESAGGYCDSDLNCENNHGCFLGNNTCVSYFSLPDGSKVDKKNGQLLCQNMKTFKEHCVSTKLSQSSDECVVTNGTIQKECSYETVGLPPQETDQIYKSKCQCSKAHSDKNFCEYDTQQATWQKLINSLKDYYNSDALKKHTIRRDQYDFDLKKNYLTVYHYPLYKDADDCTIEIDISSSFYRISYFILGLIFLFLE